MMAFLCGGFVLSLVFNFLWILSICNSDIKTIYKFVLSLFLIVFFTILFSFMFYIENKQWNNGYCLKCGTPYQAIGYYKGSTRYECPECHYAISR